MTLKPSGKPINTKCDEQAFPEFPDLLFGTTTDNGSVFDATSYLQNNSLTVDDFLQTCGFQIQALIKSYELDENKCLFINTDGHFLIDGSLVYLFLSFVEPDFLAYMCDRCHDLFTNGVAVSDSYILEHAFVRLDRESINKIKDNGKTHVK